MSSALLSRIARPSLLPRITTPDKLIPHFKNGMTIGWSGFSPAGYPKVMPLKLAEYVEENDLQGQLQFSVLAGASVGSEVEDRWVDLKMTRSRWPYQSGRAMRQAINDGSIVMGDIHLSVFAQDLEFGFFTRAADRGQIDIGIIEVTEILENGGLVLGSGIGIAPEIADKADKLILEVNTSLPSYRGLHDVVPDLIPPHRRPFLLTRVDTRIGSEYLQVDPDKIIGVIESDMPDNGLGFGAPNETSVSIAGHLLDFFEHEVKSGRLPKNLLPLQSGVGGIANAVMAGFGNGPFEGLTVWTEVAQDTMLDFIDSGKLDYVSTAAMSLSPEGFKRFYDNWDHYTKNLVIRPQQITNHPELIRRLGVIAMNTPVSIDMYGHANSTLLNGTKMVHGIGGSGDFLRSGYISIMHTPSSRPTRSDPTGISCIVPKAEHIDHTEHDLDIIVTEQGLADLRGLPPRLRAREIISKCAHPDYKDQLMDYFTMAERICLKNKAGHEPQLLDRVFRMHTALAETGSMKIDSWE